MLHLDYHLALILPHQQPAKSPGALLDAVEHVHPRLHLALAHLLLQFPDGLGELLGVVKVQETLHAGPFRDQPSIVLQPVGLLRPVGADKSTQHHPGFVLDYHEHIVEHLTPHIVEVDVDPLRVQFLQLLQHVLLLVVYHCVCTELLDVLALVVGACNPTDNAAMVFGELHRDLPHCPRRGRHHHHFALLHPADAVQPEVGGQPRDTQHAQEVLGVWVAPGQRGQLLLVQHRVLLPADEPHGQVPHLELLAAGVDDLAHAEGPHDVLGLDGGQVALDARDPDPHGGVDGDVEVLDDDVVLGHVAGGHGRHVLDLKDVLALGVLLAGHPDQPDLGVQVHIMLL